MRPVMRAIIGVVLLASISCAPPGRIPGGLAPEELAGRILDESGIHGGLVVHVGCGNGKLTEALGRRRGYVVQGLDRDAGKVQSARGSIHALGSNGRVSVDRLYGERLPYVDNLVNLLVAEDLGGVSLDEVTRVLAPGGVAYLQQAGKWTRTTKGWPAELDEWTHYLHDPQGTMVGQDTVVAPPHGLQWVSGPKWLRNHDFMSSLSAMVSSKGRIFYIIDEGLREHIYLPARWAVIARDAFNGTILWRRQIDEWFPHTWPFKSGPGYLPRRLVALGDRVYATLGINAPVSVLDAATGETIRDYPETAGTEEIVASDGVLYVVVDPDNEPVRYQHETSERGREQKRANQSFGWSKESPPRSIMALSADAGKVLWKLNRRVAPLTLAVRGKRVFFCDGEHVVALDRESGGELWVSGKAGDWAAPATGYAARLIAGDKSVVLSTHGPGVRRGRLAGLSADSGEILWQAGQPNSGHFSPEDLYLIDGLVWTAETGKSQEKGTRFLAIDAVSGDTRMDFAAKQMEGFFMHQRCYPGRATESYIMTSGTGTEFLKLGTEECELHHWIRGSCIYGLMPANGLLYKPPDSCACFYQSKLAHLCALAPSGSIAAVAETDEQARLEKGPAYPDAAHADAGHTGSEGDAWPTYRHDNARSGATAAPVPAEVERIWQTELGGKLSAMTAAGGKLFVSAIDQQRVYGLDARSGEKIWTFTPGGRVDSPPTIHHGLAIFGCADGWVYCLRASDGELAWRLRAAPGHTRLVAYEQVESVWPLHGSVLVRDGVAYCLAGRNLFLDGGLRLLRLDCVTGRLLSETVMDDKDPRSGKNLQTLMAGKAIPVANTDLFSSDGDYIYMGTQKFDFEGQRLDLDLALNKEADQAGLERHLFCPTGFLDEVWFHRSYWIYGKNAGEGHREYPIPISSTQTGRIMVFNQSRIYSFFAHNVGNNLNPETYYSIFAWDKDLLQAEKGGRKKDGYRGRSRWELEKPDLLANAMVLAGKHLFLAGAPDVADEEKTYGFVYGGDDEINRQMSRQEEAFLGKEGALVWAVSTDSGKKLSAYNIPAIPVWDGMLAADGRLYLSLKDGSVMCLGSAR